MECSALSLTGSGTTGTEKGAHLLLQKEATEVRLVVGAEFAGDLLELSDE
jgi:hypothetical protein